MEGLSEDSDDEVSSPIGSDVSSPATTPKNNEIPQSEVALLLGALLNSTPQKPALNLTYSSEFPSQSQKRTASELESSSTSSKKIRTEENSTVNINSNTTPQIFTSNYFSAPADTTLSKDFANFLVRQGIQMCRN